LFVTGKLTFWLWRPRRAEVCGWGFFYAPIPARDRSAEYEPAPEETIMKAQEFMSCPAVTVDRKTCVAEVARIMADKRVGCIIVVDGNGKLCGIVTQSDFGGDQHGVPFSMELLLQMFSRSMAAEQIQSIRKEARRKTAEQIMVTEVITASEDTQVEEMARLMLRYDIDHIPIVREGVPLGIVARHDFLRMLAESHAPISAMS
jgi:CBS domain-containing protein